MEGEDGEVPYIRLKTLKGGNTITNIVTTPIVTIVIGNRQRGGEYNRKYTPTGKLKYNEKPRATERGRDLPKGNSLSFKIICYARYLLKIFLKFKSRKWAFYKKKLTYRG